MKILTKIISYINYENPFHTLVAILGLLLRTELFDFFIKTTFSICWYVVIVIVCYIINFLLSKPLHIFSYWLVGFFYTSGDNPIFGSISYTMVYIFTSMGLMALLGYLLNLIF